MVVASVAVAILEPHLQNHSSMLALLPVLGASEEASVAASEEAEEEEAATTVAEVIEDQAATVAHAAEASDIREAVEEVGMVVHHLELQLVLEWDVEAMEVA